MGLIGPIFYWIFIFFLISRLNDRVRDNSNPNFIDSLEGYDMKDDDLEAMVNHSGEVGPVSYDDLRWDYKKQTESP